MSNESKYEGPLADPNVVDVFNLMKRETMLEINCVKVGTIESYNSATNTAEVSINLKRKLKTGEELEYPTLIDCPVFMLYGGTSSITMPISSGDGCLILFNDRSIDEWFLMGDVVAPEDKRVHSLSDGIVLVGVKPMTKQLIPISTKLCIDGGSNKIVIKNQYADIKTQLDAIIKEMQDAITQTKAIITQTQKFLDSYATLTVTAPNGPCTLSPTAAESAGEAVYTTATSGLTTASTNLGTAKTALGTLFDAGT